MFGKYRSLSKEKVAQEGWGLLKTKWDNTAANHLGEEEKGRQEKLSEVKQECGSTFPPIKKQR